jgi:hypothetical protein
LLGELLAVTAADVSGLPTPTAPSLGVATELTIVGALMLGTNSGRLIAAR